MCSSDSTNIPQEKKKIEDRKPYRGTADTRSAMPVKVLPDIKRTIHGLLKNELLNGVEIRQRTSDVVDEMIHEVDESVNNAKKSRNITGNEPLLKVIQKHKKSGLFGDIQKRNYKLKKVPSSKKNSTSQDFLTKIKKGDFNLRKVPSYEKKNKRISGVFGDSKERVDFSKPEKKLKPKPNNLMDDLNTNLKKRRKAIMGRSQQSQSSEWN